jgi:tetratricopeptide (TPR) repeat protein
MPAFGFSRWPVLPLRTGFSLRRHKWRRCSRPVRPEFETGVALVHQGRLAEAAPYLQRAQGRAARFNLALCYVGLGEYDQAAGLLEALQASGYGGARLKNQLAQAYLGEGKTEQVLEAFHGAVALPPKTKSSTPSLLMPARTRRIFLLACRWSAKD